MCEGKLPIGFGGSLGFGSKREGNFSPILSEAVRTAYKAGDTHLNELINHCSWLADWNRRATTGANNRQAVLLFGGKV